MDIDDEIRESHRSILNRIYSAFESIHRYVSDLNGFLQDLSEGIFIQRTLENMFLNADGKQLMVRFISAFAHEKLLFMLRSIYFTKNYFSVLMSSTRESF